VTSAVPAPNPSERRRLREAQLSRLSDSELRAEVRDHAAARWRSSRLLEHTKKHRPDFERRMGTALARSDLDRLSRDVLTSYSRIFTGVEHDGGLTYIFAGLRPEANGIILVVTRQHLIRSLFIVLNAARWQERHPEYIEVTERVAGH